MAKLAVRNVTKGSKYVQKNLSCTFCQIPLTLGDKVVECPECGSPHHATCWQHNGDKCGQYLCDGRGSISASARTVRVDQGREQPVRSGGGKWGKYLAAGLAAVGLVVALYFCWNSPDCPLGYRGPKITPTVEVPVPRPRAQFSASPLSGIVPCKVTFTNQSNEAKEYQWSFGDGESASSHDPVHTYEEAGIYTVKLTAINDSIEDDERKENYITCEERPIVGELLIWAKEERRSFLESLRKRARNNVGVELTYEIITRGDIDKKLLTSIAAGGGPDLLIVSHDQIGNYIEGGLISPVELGGKESLFIPSSLDAFMYDGYLFGVPLDMENVAFFRNADLVPEPMETWDEVYETCSRLIYGDPLEWCTVFPDTNYHIYGLHSSFGGYIFGRDSDGTYDPRDVGLDSPGFVASGEYIQAMVDEGLIPPSAEYSTAINLFQDGKIPFVLAGPWVLDDFRESGVNFAVDPIPAGDSGPGSPFLGVQGFVVNAQSENLELVQEFLAEVVATDETMNMDLENDWRIPAWGNALLQVDQEDLAGFAAIAPYASPMPSIPEMGAVWGSWGDTVQLIMNGEDVTESLTNGADQIREAIDSQ